MYGHIYGVVHRVKKTIKVTSEVKSAVDEFEALLASIRCDAEGRPTIIEPEGDDETGDGNNNNINGHNKDDEDVEETTVAAGTDRHDEWMRLL